MRYTVFLILALFMPALGRSAIIHVPGDYPTIQGAIDAAKNLDTIQVAPGTYVENIDFKGKNVRVKSDRGAKVTTIDGNRSGSVVRFAGGETAPAGLVGFTLVHGLDALGGGIYCQGASPDLMENIITSCRATGDGGGIYVYDSAPMIVGNRIIENSANVAGGIMCNQNAAPLISGNTIKGNSARDCGGIGCYSQSSPTIVRNIISRNTARNPGGGILCVYQSSPQIEGNTISGNSAAVGGGIVIYDADSVLVNNVITRNRAWHSGGGLYCVNAFPEILGNTLTKNRAEFYGGAIYCYQSDPKFNNTVLWNNDAPEGPAAWVYSAPSVIGLTIRYSDVEGGKASIYAYPGSAIAWGPGMIDADPLFVDPESGDFHLRFHSPCREAGDHLAPGLPPGDFEGDPRIAHGTIDMGADEFHTHFYVMGKASPGGSVKLNFVDLPGTNPVGLFLCTEGIYPAPIPSPYGDWYLIPPVSHLFPLSQIPAPGGVLTLDMRIPIDIPAPSTIYMQSHMGTPWHFTNPFVLDVE